MANNKIRLVVKNTLVYNAKVYVAGNELTADEMSAERFVKRNLATVIDEQVKETEDEHIEDELDDMTVEELKEYAEEAGVSLKGLTRKGDIINAIREAI